MNNNNNNNKNIKNYKNNNGISIIDGVVPPNAVDIEKSILGNIINKSKLIEVVIDVKLKPECFYDFKHILIFKNMLDMYNRSYPIDMLTLNEQMNKSGELEKIGGAYYLTKISNEAIEPINIKSHAIIVIEKFILREVSTLSISTYNDSVKQEKEVFSIVNEISQKASEITSYISDMKAIKISDVAMNVINKLYQRVELARKGLKNENDIFTGLKQWDELNGSLFPAVYTVAGRPAMGKGVHLTELVCRMGKNYKIGVVNGEMTNEQLLIRIGCNLLGINNELWKRDPNEITDDDLSNVENAMNEAINLKFNLTHEKEIHKICNKIRIWVKEGVKCVIIDFLNILSVDSESSNYWNDTQKLNYLMEKIADTSKELEVPIILYVQMNREILKRNGAKEPNMGDLKGSGKIDELSYQISFLHRPEYYDPSSVVDEFGESTKGLMYQIVAKHRDGKVDKLKYRAILACSQIKDWDEDVYTEDKLKVMPF